MCFIDGFALAGVTWLVLLRFRTGALLYHPGHWILGALGVPLAIGLVLPIFSWALDGLLIIHWLLASFIPDIASVIIIVWAAVRHRGWWRCFFAAWATASGSAKLSTVLLILNSMRSQLNQPTFPISISLVFQCLFVIGALVAGIAVIGAVVTDIRRKKDRDWLHKIALFMMVLNVAIYAWSYFFYGFMPI